MSAINPAAVLFDVNGNPLTIVSGSMSVTGTVTIGDITFPETVLVSGTVGIDTGISVLNFPVTQSIVGSVFVTSTGSLLTSVSSLPSVTGSVNVTNTLFNTTGSVAITNQVTVTTTGSLPVAVQTLPSISGSVNVTNELFNVTGSVGISGPVSVLGTVVANVTVTGSTGLHVAAPAATPLYTTGSVGITNQVVVTTTGSLPVTVQSPLPAITGSVNVTNALFNVTGSVGIGGPVSITSTGSLPVSVQTLPAITGSVNVTNSLFNVTGSVGIGGPVSVLGTVTSYVTVTGSQGLHVAAPSTSPLYTTGSVAITNQVTVTTTGSLPVAIQTIPAITGSVNVTNSLFNVTGSVGVNNLLTSKISDGSNTAAVKAASTAALATDPALVVAISPNNSITTALSADAMSSYSPDQGSYITGTGNLTVDASGRLETHSTVLTDEGSFRDDFTGTSLTTALTGTNVTFTNNSTAVTGVGTSFTTQIKAGDYIKKTADGEANYAQVLSVESDTALTLATPYAGTTATTTGVVSKWATVTAATAGSIAVANSAVSLGSGTGNGESTYITRTGDYMPYTLNVNLTVSQRVANQTVFLGFRDQLVSPNYRCEIQFTGTDNTQVNFVTSGGPNAADTTTLVAILPTSTTALSHQYKIDLSGNQATLSIDGAIAATSTLHLPPPYATLNIYAGTTNSAIVTATTLAIDAIYWFNTDRVQVDNDFKGEPLPVTIASPVAALAPFIQVGGNSLDAFGDTVTHQYTPVWQMAFVSGGGGVNGSFNTTIPNQLGASYTNGTGAVTSGPYNASTPSLLKLDTGGTAANAAANFRGVKYARYRPGQGMLMRYSVVFGTGVARTYQYAGIGDDSNGYFFGYNLTSFGILYRSSGTGARVDTWIPQSSWNVDKCDGTGPSGFNVNPQKGNIYQIKYPYLGYGPIFFQILNPALNTWITAHVIEYPNANTTVQIADPAMTFYVVCTNDQTGGTTAVMYVGSAGIFLSGQRLFLGSQFAATTPAQASVTTEASLLGIANARGVNGIANHSLLRMRTLSVASDGGNGISTVRLYRGLVPSGATWTTINGTAQGNPASTAATTVAAGSNNTALPTGTISVASTAGFPAAGTLLITTTLGPQVIMYTGTTGTTFTGCTGGIGVLLTGQAVSLVASITSMQSTAFFSTTQTTTLTTTNAQVVWNTVLARNSVVSLDMTAFDLFLAPGETWWLTGFASASSTFAAAINWTEDAF